MVNLLSHTVGEEGIETDSTETDTIKNYPRLSNSVELISCLALAGCYHKFVQNVSKVSRPLADVLPPTSLRKKGRKQHQVKDWHWGEVEEQPFVLLKYLLTSPPTSAFPNFDLPFELHTYASGNGLRTVVYQLQSGKQRVIPSISLSKSEKTTQLASWSF